MYTVVGLPQTRAFRVLWALEELELEYTLNPVAPASDEARAIIPSGKVPVLIEGDFQLSDSVAILHYLADKHGKLLAPAGTRPRALQDAMTFRLLDELDAVVWTLARHSFVLPQEQRVPEVKPSLSWEFTRNLDRLAQDLTTPFVTGDSFSVADILFETCISWAQAAKIEIENKEVLERVKTLRAREAYQRLLPLLK